MASNKERRLNQEAHAAFVSITRLHAQGADAGQSGSGFGGGYGWVAGCVAAGDATVELTSGAGSPAVEARFEIVVGLGACL